MRAANLSPAKRKAIAKKVAAAAVGKNELGRHPIFNLQPKLFDRGPDLVHSVICDENQPMFQCEGSYLNIISA